MAQGLLSVMWQSGWREFGENDTFLCMAETLCCPPEIITLLICTNLKQNIFKNDKKQTGTSKH